MYYNSVVSYNNLTYSVDMLRLKAYIDYDKFSNLDFYLKTYHNEKIEKYWISDRKGKFKYNFDIAVCEGKSFYLGFHHNNEKDIEYGYHNLTIEFNPNKLKDNKIISHILNLSGEWFIRSYDLAVDIKCNIMDIIFDKGRKRKVQSLTYGFDDFCYKIGTGDNKFKIYNKKVESSLDVPYELTRIEITRMLEDFPVGYVKYLKFDLSYFPELYMNDYICSLSDYKDMTLFAIVYAVQKGFPLNKLSRRYREKVKQLFEGGQRIRFTDKDAITVLRKTILSYFMKNEKVRWR